MTQLKGAHVEGERDDVEAEDAAPACRRHNDPRHSDRSMTVAATAAPTTSSRVYAIVADERVEPSDLSGGGVSSGPAASASRLIPVVSGT